LQHQKRNLLEILATDVDHGARRLEESRLADVVASLLSLDSTVNVGAEFGVRFAVAQAAVEVVVDLGEEAGADFAVGGEADTAAGAAEGLGDGGDDANFAAAIGKAVAAGGLTCFARRQLDQRQDTADAGDDLLERDHDFRGPEAAFFQRHELNEADGDIFVAGEMGKAFDLVVIEATHEYAVDFEGVEAGGAGGTNACEDLGKAARNAGDALEGGCVDGVHADGDTVEAGGLEGSGERFEKVSVGGEGEMERVAGEGGGAGEFADQIKQAAPQEGFATGEPNFGDAEADKEADEAEVGFDW